MSSGTAPPIPSEPWSTRDLDLDAWYRRYGPLVQRRCKALLRDEDQARDAAHDVFVELLRRPGRYEPTAPSALLLRIATRVCLNRLRTRRRRPEHSDEHLLLQIATAESRDSPAFARSILDRVFGREPESTAVMAVMLYVDGMTLEEVAKEVGLSVSGVRKRIRTLKANVASLEEVEVHERKKDT